MMLAALEDHLLLEAWAGYLFLHLKHKAPETQKNFLSIHKTRMIQAAWLICKAGISRERFRLSAGDITQP